MLDEPADLDALLDLARQLDVQIRREPIDGQGGGLCRIRGQSILFIDTLADLPTRIERCLEALATHPEVDNCYVRPDLREHLDRLRP